MSKKWYEYFVSVENDGTSAQPAGKAPDDAALAIAQIAASVNPAPAPAGPVRGFPSLATPGVRPVAAQAVGPLPSAQTAQLQAFEDIYAAAEIKPPANGYTILKISEMLSSEHIKNMPAEVKRGSILVALEAAGVKLDDVIQDAIRRDQALDAFERVKQKSVEDIEARKLEENRKLQADLDKYVAEQRARIQANLDEVTNQKDTFFSWRMSKQQEEQKIADCVSYFVTDNPITTATQPRTAGGGSKTGA